MMKIKVKEITKGSRFLVLEKGDWIDLKSAAIVDFKSPTFNPNKELSFDSKMIKLGIAMKLPKGYEAIVLPRSGLYKTHPIIVRNSAGIIDNSYSGNSDEWGFLVIALGATTINKGERICQFRIQLSQKATMWQKLKWLFSSNIEFEWVDNLDSINRGGFGSTGLK